MSRFFAGAGSSSESDSDELVKMHGLEDGEKSLQRRKFLADSSDDSSYSEAAEDMEDDEAEVVDATKNEQRDKELEARRSRFLIGSGSDSEEEDVHRVVKSQREKALEEISTISEAIGDAIDEDEWTAVSNDFDRLLKCANRAIKLGPLPETFFDFAEFLSDVFNDKTADQVKKMKADEARAFNSLRQKFKKLSFEEYRKPDSMSTVTSPSELKDVETDLLALEVTPQTIPQRIQEILGSRGKRRIAERTENVAVLRKCLVAANSLELKAQVLVALLSTLLDSSGTMAIDQFGVLLDSLTELNDCLLSLSMLNGKRTAEEALIVTNYVVSFGSLLQRCDDELKIALNTCDHHSPAYLELIKVEMRVIKRLSNSLTVMKAFGLDEFVLECQGRLLDRTFYRTSPSVPVKPLLNAFYQSGQESLQIKALLCHISILSSQNRFLEGRNLLVSTKVSENIQRHSPTLQTLFNRTLVHLGLAAFRTGQLAEAYYCLQEICSSGRPKELLGQGLTHHNNHSPAHQSHSERTERLRLLPHHLHFNIELIDTVFSTVSMLLELPQVAAQHSSIHQPNPRKVFQSRHLKRIIDVYERSLFNGPPENSRETVTAACRALANADWSKCLELLGEGIKVWSGIGGGYKVEDVKKILSEKIKKCALLLHIYTLAGSLACVSIPRLSEQFNLPSETVKLCLDAHSSALTTEDGVQFKWREDRQLRRDYYERTMAHLRVLCLPHFSENQFACEYIMYGATSGELPVSRQSGQSIE